jgi:hypothetical protein
MWESNGDINGGHIQQVDSGDMLVNGKIDSNSFGRCCRCDNPVHHYGSLTLWRSSARLRWPARVGAGSQEG